MDNGTTMALLITVAALASVLACFLAWRQHSLIEKVDGMTKVLRRLNERSDTDLKTLLGRFEKTQEGLDVIVGRIESSKSGTDNELATLRGLTSNILAKTDKTGLPTDGLEPEIDWSRWTPMVSGEAYVASYGEFVRRYAVKDTLSKRVRFFAMSSALEALARRGELSGQVAECGCYLGHTSFIIASVLKRHQFNGRFHIFDSFEGLSEATDKDVEPLKSSRESANELRANIEPKNGKRRFSGGLEIVQRHLADFDFIDYHPGWIPEQFPSVADQRFSFVNLDVDLYEPTRDALAFFWPRLDKNGMIWLDDYALTSWPGCTRAVDEWMISVRPDLVLPAPGGGLLIVK